MNPRVLLAILLLTGAGGAFLLVRFLFFPPPPPGAPPPVPVERVLVLARDMQEGQFLHESDLREKTIEAVHLPPQVMLDTAENRHLLEGAVLRETIQADNVLLRTIFARVGDPGFLAAVLRPGMRAVSVPVNLVSSISGLIQPGDYVDVVLIMPPQPGQGVGSVQARGILGNIRVLAVGQVMESAQPSARGARPGAANGQPPPSAVTLEVTPEGVGILGAATQMGQFLLTIRSLGAAATTVPTVKGADVAGMPDPEHKDGAATQNRTVVHVYNGPGNAQNAEF